MEAETFQHLIAILNLNTELETGSNVPASLVQPGNGLSFNQPSANRSTTGWTLEDYFNLAEYALQNGATFDQADRFCMDKCNMTFGALYNFVQLLRNPIS